VPPEYKAVRNEEELNSSTGISAGFGVNYKLSSKIDLDFRYFYKTDSELIDTHQFLLGIRI
jgi:opacity protein-like surface antigen